MAMEYYSFEKVLKELQMEEDELKRLVSEGEIRAFRDEDKMKFKKSDIDGLKKGRMTEPTIILPSGEPDDSSEDSEVLLVEEDTSETLLDIDDLDSADSSSTSVPTVDFSSSEFEDSSASETITEELTFEEDSGSYVLESSDDVLIDSSGELVDIDDEVSGDTFVDSDTGLQTEPLDMELDSDEIIGADTDDELTTEELDDSDSHTIAVDDPDEEEETMAPAMDITGPIGGGAPVGRTGTVQVPTMVEPQPLPPFILASLIMGTLFMLFTGVIMLNSMRVVDTPITGWFTDKVYEYIAPTHYVYKNPGRALKVDESKLRKRLKWRQKIRDGRRR